MLNLSYSVIWGCLPSWWSVTKEIGTFSINRYEKCSILWPFSLPSPPPLQVTFASYIVPPFIPCLEPQLAHIFIIKISLSLSLSSQLCFPPKFPLWTKTCLKWQIVYFFPCQPCCLFPPITSDFTAIFYWRAPEFLWAKGTSATQFLLQCFQSNIWPGHWAITSGISVTLV